MASFITQKGNFWRSFYFSASHGVSERMGLKEINNQGGQLLLSDSLETVRELKAMLEEIQSEAQTEPAPPGSAWLSRYRVKRRAASVD